MIAKALQTKILSKKKTNDVRSASRVARFSLVQYTKMGKIRQTATKCRHLSYHMINNYKIHQIAVKHGKISRTKAYHNTPKLRFFYLEKNHLATLSASAKYTFTKKKKNRVFVVDSRKKKTPANRVARFF
jgi:hypothetical protein